MYPLSTTGPTRLLCASSRAVWGALRAGTFCKNTTCYASLCIQRELPFKGLGVAEPPFNKCEA
jgi:hypothetical protein